MSFLAFKFKSLSSNRPNEKVTKIFLFFFPFPWYLYTYFVSLIKYIFSYQEVICYVVIFFSFNILVYVHSATSCTFKALQTTYNLQKLGILFATFRIIVFFLYSIKFSDLQKIFFVCNRN